MFEYQVPSWEIWTSILAVSNSSSNISVPMFIIHWQNSLQTDVYFTLCDNIILEYGGNKRRWISRYLHDNSCFLLGGGVRRFRCLGCSLQATWWVILFTEVRRRPGKGNKFCRSGALATVNILPLWQIRPFQSGSVVTAPSHWRHVHLHGSVQSQYNEDLISHVSIKAHQIIS